jgi:hypothetical protein
MEQQVKITDEAKVMEIKARIETIKNARQDYMLQAEKQMAGFNAVIHELEQMIEPEVEDEEPQEIDT